MKNASIQTKSFIILFSIAAIGSVVSLLMSNHINLKKNGSLNDYQVITYGDQNAQHPDGPVQIPPPPPVDTTTWKTYEDTSHHIKFAIDPAWKVKSITTKYGYTVLPIDPGPKYDDIRIYINDNGFFGLDGLPHTQDTIAGTQAIDIQSMLFGIQHNGIYYTFDLGASLSLRPKFTALVKSVTFAN